MDWYAARFSYPDLDRLESQVPSIFTHAVVGIGLARIFTARSMPASYWLLAASLSMLPDLDVIAFAFGIPYGARFGHRGFAHSLFFALLVSAAAATWLYRRFPTDGWLLWATFFVITASHGILDAFTNGGMGIALLAPFDWSRLFFAWTPIQVSPIGLGFFSAWGLRAFLSEVLWVWLPLGIVVAGVTFFRWH